MLRIMHDEVLSCVISCALHAGSKSLHWWKVCWWWIWNLVAAQPESFDSTTERCRCNFQEDRL